jgi:hypothetical protein
MVVHCDPNPSNDTGHQSRNGRVGRLIFSRLPLTKFKKKKKKKPEVSVQRRDTALAGFLPIVTPAAGSLTTTHTFLLTNRCRNIRCGCGHALRHSQVVNSSLFLLLHWLHTLNVAPAYRDRTVTRGSPRRSCRARWTSTANLMVRAYQY